MPYKIKDNKTLVLKIRGSVSTLAEEAAALKNRPDLIEKITEISLSLDKVILLQVEDFLALAEIISAFTNIKSFQLLHIEEDFNIPLEDIDPRLLEDINPLLEVLEGCRFQHLDIFLECSYLMPVMLTPINTEEMISFKCRCANFDNPADAIKIKNMFQYKLRTMQQQKKLENLESLTLTYAGCPSDDNLVQAISKLNKLRSLELNDWDFVNNNEVKFLTKLLNNLPHLPKLCLTDTYIGNREIAKQLVTVVQSHPALEYFSHERRDNGGRNNRKIGFSAMGTELVKSGELADKLKLNQLRRQLREDCKNKDWSSLKEQSLNAVLKQMPINDNPLRAYSFFKNKEVVPEDLQTWVWGERFENIIKANFERVAPYLVNCWRRMNAVSSLDVDFDKFLEEHERSIRDNFEGKLKKWSKDTILGKPNSKIALLSFGNFKESNSTPVYNYVFLHSNGNVEVLCSVATKVFALTDLIPIPSNSQTVLGKRKLEDEDSSEVGREPGTSFKLSKT